jgi:arylformamidase
MPLFDVSVPLGPETPTYPGNTPFALEPMQRIAQGGHSNVSSIHMSAHGGTHVDAPRHYFDQGTTTETLALDLLIGPARVVSVTSERRVEADDLASFVQPGDQRILIRTSNSALWTSRDFHADYVGVGATGAKFLVDRGIKLVGLDYVSVEKYHEPGTPAHHTLLAANVIIVEGLNLSAVEPGLYQMYCLPLKIVGSDGAPARVVLQRN